MRLESGQRFGDLLVEDEIGTGAFATVYRARDEIIGRHVALKVVEREGGAEGERRARAVLREARLMGALSSPYVVTLYRLHVADDESLVFELELVDGGTLEERLAELGQLAESDVRRVVRGVLEALATAHEQGVLHRDVKPANVLLGSGGAVKLADFGLGHLIGQESLSSQEGSRLAGTPAYMAPEVFAGRPASQASDLWSVGALLYRLLSGRLPFPAGSLAELYVALAEREPAPLDPHVASDLAALCRACLHREPEARPATARAALGLLDDAPRAAAPPEPPPTPVSAAQPRYRPLLYGRETELATLTAFLERVVHDGTGGLAWISGRLGAGKSAVLAAAGEQGRRLGMQVLSVPLAASGGLRRALGRAARAERATPTPGQAVSSTDDLLALLTSGDADQAEPTRFAWTLERVLRELALAAPLLVLVDDVHVADVEDLHLLLEVIRHLGDAPVAVIATATDADIETSTVHDVAWWSALRDLQKLAGPREVQLPPLSPEALHALLEREAGSTPLGVSMLDIVLRKADGNPLYALEVFRELARQGTAAFDIAQSVPSLEAVGGRVPRHVRDIVAGRVALLDESDRMLLDASSVDGVEFDGRAVASVLGLPLLPCLQRLQALQRQHGLVTSAQEGYRFAHVLYRDVIYEQIGGELRREVHRLLAEHLDARRASEPVDPQRLGRHWERAGAPERARPFLAEAAAQAVRRQENLRAVELAQRAGLLTFAWTEAVDAHAELLIGLAGCLADLGRRDDSARLLRVLSEAATAQGNDELALRAFVVDSELHRHYAGPKGLDAERLADAARRLPEGREQGLALLCLAQIEVALRGRADVAEPLARQAEEVFRACGEDIQRCTTLAVRATIARALGHADDAETLWGQAADLSRRLGRRANAAVADVSLAYLRFLRGSVDGVPEIYERAQRVFALAGRKDNAAHTGVHLARVYECDGRLVDAVRATQAAVDLLEADGSSASHAYARLHHASLLLALGRQEEARACIAQLGELAERAGLSPAHLWSRALGAVAALREGDAVEAAEHLEAAVQIGTTSSDSGNRIDAAEALALAYIVRGEKAPARLAELPPADEALDGVTRVRALVRLAVGDRTPAAQRAAAEQLLTSAGSDRRAQRQATAHLLEAQAALAEGDRAGFERSREAARDAARRMGHVALIEAVERLG
ncbi:MAG: protein kinase [Planctomycetes bacterium]|nr:protein kinase [Planctomycetota bacterium]MCB9825023.1 protein kinase [Planctomycetota bacterium]MCB9828912.1 protein kinase [Planctomycetota bacterium]